MMIKTNTWQKNTLLEGLSPQELAEVISIARDISFQKGELIVEEGTRGEQFFFIVSGRLEVLKEGHQIHILEEGDVVGELAILGGKPRIATVRALQDTVAKEVGVRNLSQNIIDKLAKNLSYLFSTRLSITDQLAAQALQREIYQIKRRGAMSGTSAKAIINVSLYVAFAQQIIQYFPFYYLPIFSGIYLGGVAYYLSWDMIRQGYPLSMFGMTLRNWKRSLKETFLFMLPLLLGIVVMKKIAILTNPAYAGQPLFRLGLDVPSGSSSQTLLLSTSLIFYILFSPIQELIFRGFIQTSWQRFSSGPRRTLMAIFVSSILYLNAHFYWSLSPIILLVSFLWGWLFARHRTLVGVAMGHTLLSVWVFWVVGFVF